MDAVLGVILLVVSIAGVVFVGALFIWAARKDGEADQAVQRRLGIKRRTRLGR